MSTTGDRVVPPADATGAQHKRPARPTIGDRLLRGGHARRCALCGQPIRGGQRVRRLHGTAVHANCARASPPGGAG